MVYSCYTHIILEKKGLSHCQVDWTSIAKLPPSWGSVCRKRAAGARPSDRCQPFFCGIFDMDFTIDCMACNHRLYADQWWLMVGWYRILWTYLLYWNFFTGDFSGNPPVSVQRAFFQGGMCNFNLLGINRLDDVDILQFLIVRRLRPAWLRLCIRRVSAKIFP